MPARDPRIEKSADGTFVLRGIPPLMALALRELPSLLSDDAPGIRDRLSGSPYPGDPASTRQWEKYALPELAHLFEAARTTVGRDVAGIAPEPRSPNRFRLPIPVRHLPAWLSSLAAVRVALAESHDIEESDMESPLPPVVLKDRERALVLIHLLGWVQGLLVEAGA